MTDVVDSGLAGVSLSSGDHACALYFGEIERDSIVTPFLRSGLQTGEKCLCLVDRMRPDEVVEAVGHGLDADGWVSSGQLEIATSVATYAPGSIFAKERMIEFLSQTVAGATGPGGYHRVRVVGEMTWVLRQPAGADQLMDYESEVNRIAPRFPQVLLCLYDVAQFGGGIIVDLLRTHPKVLFSGTLIDNPNFLTPDEYRAIRS
jgi:hypothetical protein